MYSESQDDVCRLCVQPWGWSGRHLIVVKARMTDVDYVYSLGGGVGVTHRSESQDDGCRLCSLGMQWAYIVEATMTDVYYVALGWSGRV